MAACGFYRYRAFRDQDGNLTLTYWHLLAVRLGFVIVFEVPAPSPAGRHGCSVELCQPLRPSRFQHVVFFIGRVIACLVPDIPESVEVKVKRERYLAKEALAENKVCAAAFRAGSVVPVRSSSTFCECKQQLPFSMIQVLLERREARSKASTADPAASRDWETEQVEGS